MFVHDPYKFVKEHPNVGVKLKILYFALEESKEEFMFALISNRLKTKYNISISTNDLQSRKKVLSDEILDKILECEEYFADLEDCLEIIDGISNPTGIFKYVQEYADNNGTHYYYDYKKDKHRKNPIRKQDLKPNQENIGYYKYEPFNPDEYVIVICDHLSLLETEKNAKTLHESMTRISAEYARKWITKHFKYVFVGVQQQAADKEKLQFTNTGKSITEKLEPSLDGLGDNKLTQRDALVVLGLFAPERYNIKHYLGYDVGILKDKFRSLIILKNRIGRPNLKLGLYFDGETNVFKELPKVMTEMDYEKYS